MLPQNLSGWRELSSMLSDPQYFRCPAATVTTHESATVPVIQISLMRRHGTGTDKGCGRHAARSVNDSSDIFVQSETLTGGLAKLLT